MAGKKNFAVDILRTILLMIFYLILITIAVYVLSYACRGAYRFAYQVFGDVVVTEPPGENKTISISKDMDEQETAKLLEQEGIIVNRYSFLIRLKLTLDKTHELTPGDYVLNTSMTYDEVLERIVRGEENGR